LQEKNKKVCGLRSDNFFSFKNALDVSSAGEAQEDPGY